MKTWITYLAAAAMGLAATLLFGETAAYQQSMSIISSFLVQFGSFILLPLVFIGFASGVASLRKDSRGGTVAWTTILWSFCGTVLLTVLGAVAFKFLPAMFPATSTAGANAEIVNSIGVGTFSEVLSSVFQGNPFYTLVVSGTYLLPIIFVAWILGFAIKPNVEVIRPAYVVMNSFSEAMFRVAYIFSCIGFAFLFFISAAWFAQVWKDGTVFVAISFMRTLLIIVGIMLFGFLPLFYAVFTKFRRNPYRELYRMIAPATAALFSGNIFFSTPILMSVTRHNLGTQKRISATAIPAYTVIGRGGSALVATICVCSLLYAATGSVPSWTVVLMVAGACTQFSFICSFSLGFEVVFISIVALRILKIDLYGAEMTLFGLLPVLNGLGIMMDTVIAGLGTSATSDIMGTTAPAPYKTTL